ncbi:MAG: LamG-like jellyroll fold domain-containing protein, partial [Victivallales bacterium]
VGRWPWKKALACGSAAPQLVRSRFHGTDGVFTVEAWVRPHPLGEDEWAEGDLLALGQGYGSGWRIVASRQKWSKDGHATFRLGVPKGVVLTPFHYAFNTYVPFAFGSWHHLVAVWDGKEARLYVDGKAVAVPTPGPNPLPPPAKGEQENDIGGLVIGGKLRFDIDELVIYDHALSASEIEDSYAKFRPVEKAAAVSDPVVFEFPRQSGGYFTVGKPIESFVRTSQRAGDTARCTVKPRNGGAAIYERNELLDKADARFSFNPGQCGLFDVELSLRNAAGELLRRETFPIGVVVPLAEGDAGLGVRHSGAVQPWARSLGITRGRVLVNWRHSEPEKGVYNWSLSDQMMETASASGLNVVCCVTGLPSWLGTNTVDLGAYRNFLELLSRRYHKEVAAWEIWDNNFGARESAFPGSKEDFAKFSATAADALGAPPVNQGGLRVARFGFRQPAAAMGDFNPGDFDSPIYAKRIREEGGDRCMNVWPWPLFSAQRSAVIQVWKALEVRTAAADAVVLDCAPDEYYPAWNTSDGTPSEQGVALAALSLALAGATSVQELPVSKGLRMFRIVRAGADTLTVLGAKDADGVKVRLVTGVEI